MVPWLPALKLHSAFGFVGNCRFALTQSESSGPALGTTGATTAMLTRSVAVQPDASV